MAEAEFTSAEHEKSTGPRGARKQYMEKYQMIRYDAGEYDIAVIGAGHAGIEAALAAARMGLRTLCFTINLDAVGLSLIHI